MNRPNSLPDEENFKQVCKNADSALYEAKTGGKSRRCIFEIESSVTGG